MDWQEWVIEHIVEIVSLFVTLFGFGYTVKYVKQISVKNSLSLNKSDNNLIIQAQKVSTLDLNKFSYEAHKRIVSTSENKTDIDSLEKDSLFKKIQNSLDDDKPVSTIAEMCLRLAKHLKMKSDIEWLDGEVNGFYQQKKSDKGIEFMDTSGSQYKAYRRIKARLYIQTQDMIEPKEFDLKIFIAQPLRDIEFWANQVSYNGKTVIRTSPLRLMVETLHVNPEEEVPYIIDSSEIHGIIVGVRIELNRFIERTKKSNENID